MDDPVCAACGNTVTDSELTPDDEVVVQAEAAAVGLEEILWVCGDCFRLMRTLKERGVDGD